MKEYDDLKYDLEDEYYKAYHIKDVDCTNEKELRKLNTNIGNSMNIEGQRFIAYTFQQDLIKHYWNQYRKPDPNTNPTYLFFTRGIKTFGEDVPFNKDDFIKHVKKVNDLNYSLYP
jgi:hypothetical protein